jgi:pyruvate/2-oxoglutarate dehydrogenase complex dihydrolipoamide acyltransferase (E2) component
MPESIPVTLPRENLNDESVTLVAWLVANGTRVAEGQALAELESSKAVFEIPAPASGIVQYTHREGEDVEVGGVLCYIDSDGKPRVAEEVSILADDNNAAVSLASEADAPSPSVAAESANVGSGAVSSSSGRQEQPTRFSQKARELLKQYGLNPELFAGHGLVRASDILEKLGQGGAQVTTPSANSTAVSRAARVVPEPLPAAGVPFRTQGLPRSKRAEARSLASSYYNTLPSVITVAIPTRGLRAAAEQHTKIQGHTAAIILFEVARLLRKYPHFNAFYTHESINLYEEVNIGFAIDAGRGLKVPVIRKADTKGIPEIASEMQQLLVDYLNDRLSIEALSGGTFTITDLSREGVFTFQPLINQGQAAILGVGGEFFPLGSHEGMFTLILSFDHQLAEGRQAAQFLHELGQRLEAYEAALGGAATSSGEIPEEPSCGRCLTPLSRLHDWDQFLVQTIRPHGKVAYVCSICLQGW